MDGNISVSLEGLVCLLGDLSSANTCPKGSLYASSSNRPSEPVESILRLVAKDDKAGPEIDESRKEEASDGNVLEELRFDSAASGLEVLNGAAEWLRNDLLWDVIISGEWGFALPDSEADILVQAVTS